MPKTKSTSTKKRTAKSSRKTTKKSWISRYPRKNVLAALAVFAVVVVVGILLIPSFAASPKRLHFIQNTDPWKDANKLKSLGYNVIDTNPDIGAINSLPSGMQAMVWTGGAVCDDKAHGGIMGWDSFRAFVRAHYKNPKIQGYFIFDEPDTHRCKNIEYRLRDRADFIHCLAYRGDYWDSAKKHPKVASDGSCLDKNGKKTARKSNQKAYLVDEWNFDYKRVRESVTHVDLFAIDPYPCRAGQACKWTGDPAYFRERIARAKTYFTDSHIVPTFQAFGGDGWRMPSTTEMKQILVEYDRALPNVQMDVAYSWRDNKSGGPADTYPGLIRSTSIQAVLKEYNNKH